MDDRQIIELYFCRDERAIAESDKKYGAYCQTIAYNVLEDRESAEECVSDTWWKSWRAIPPQLPNCLRAFFGRITRNLALDRYRAESRRKGGAEAMLRNGYVFSNHSCRLCMQNRQKVDFTDYDRVSLEYVFASDDIRGYGIPFYTFYKRIRVNENGFVQYAKTMVPAIEVSGLQAYFEDQVQHHPG